MAHSLDPLFKPGSIAVIGASAKKGKVGHALIRNLFCSPCHVDPKKKL